MSDGGGLWKEEEWWQETPAVPPQEVSAGPDKEAVPRPPPSAVLSLRVSPPLPAHFAPLVEAARSGRIRKGAASLACGMVVDLNEYVSAWAASWPTDGHPADTAHITRRLQDAHDWIAANPAALHGFPPLLAGHQTTG